MKYHPFFFVRCLSAVWNRLYSTTVLFANMFWIHFPFSVCFGQLFHEINIWILSHAFFPFQGRVVGSVHLYGSEGQRLPTQLHMNVHPPNAEIHWGIQAGAPEANTGSSTKWSFWINVFSAVWWNRKLVCNTPSWNHVPTRRFSPDFHLRWKNVRRDFPIFKCEAVVILHFSFLVGLY